MAASEISEAKLQELGRASRRAGVLSALGALLVLGAMGYAAMQVRYLQRERQRLEDSIGQLQSHIDSLVQTQAGLLDFLGGITAADQIRLIDPSVNWQQTKNAILEMPAGPRKTAVLAAILLAWKELPFSTTNRSLSSGLDSPHLINKVLSSVGVHVKQNPGERLSDAMMRQFQRVNSPLPGDLIFYTGKVGSFVVMYIGPGSPEGQGVAVGALEQGAEIQVLDTTNINTPFFPPIGFFRVPYPG